jgi:hypothetical protein
LFVGVLAGLAPAAVGAEEGVGDEVDEGGEGEEVLAAAAAVALEDVIEEGWLEEVVRQGEDGIGHGEASEGLPGEGLRSGFLTRRQQGELLSKRKVVRKL